MAAEVRPVELLILDVYMPRMSGLELLRELRAEEITLDVVMVTAANDSRTVDALLKLGVADYLVKPFTARRFQQALDTFVPPAGGHHRPRQRQPGGPGRPPLQRPQRRPRPQGPAARAPWPACGTAWPRRPGRAAPARPWPSRWASPPSPSAATSPTLVGRGEAVSRINYDTGGRPSLLYRLSQTEGT